MGAAALLMLSALIFPAPRQDGSFATLSIGVSQLYDDELAGSRAGPAEALFTRLSPRLSLGYRSPRLSLLGFAALDAELDDANPRESRPWARRTGNVELLAVLTDRLTMTGGATYWDTRTPRDAAVGPAFDPGVVDLQSVRVGTTLDYRLTALSDATLFSELVRTEQAGVVIDELRIAPGLLTKVTRRDVALLRVLVRNLTFAGRFATLALVPTLGWTRQLTRTLAVSLEGGPRIASGSLDGVEGTASAQLDLRTLSGVLSFSSSQMAVPGLVGAVDALSASASGRYRLTREASVGATAALYMARGAPLQARTAQLGLDALVPLSRSIALGGAARHYWQQVERLGVRAPASHDQVLMTLTLAAEIL